jgi:hypothetical protein
MADAPALVTPEAAVAVAAAAALAPLQTGALVPAGPAQYHMPVGNTPAAPPSTVSSGHLVINTFPAMSYGAHNFAIPPPLPLVFY